MAGSKLASHQHPWLGMGRLLHLVPLTCHFEEGHGNPLQYSWPENPMDEDPGGLQSRASQGVRHDLTTVHASSHAICMADLNCFFECLFD